MARNHYQRTEKRIGDGLWAKYRTCVQKNPECKGPLAPAGSFVCVECSDVYLRLVDKGQIPDFVEGK